MQIMLFLNQLYSVWDELLDTYGVYKVETIGEYRYQFSHTCEGYFGAGDPLLKAA